MIFILSSCCLTSDQLRQVNELLYLVDTNFRIFLYSLIGIYFLSMSSVVSIERLSYNPKQEGIYGELCMLGFGKKTH